MIKSFNPPHPGEFIRETYLQPLDISLRQAARALNVSSSTFSRLVAGTSELSPEMALKLSKAFGRSPESWLNLQRDYTLWQLRQKVNLASIKVLYQHIQH